jgi:hypothetical protein
MQLYDLFRILIFSQLYYTHHYPNISETILYNHSIFQQISHKLNKQLYNHVYTIGGPI